eukprot:767151-Hanusia_phi.AAC.3
MLVATTLRGQPYVEGWGTGEGAQSAADIGRHHSRGQTWLTEGSPDKIMIVPVELHPPCQDHAQPCSRINLIGPSILLKQGSHHGPICLKTQPRPKGSKGLGPQQRRRGQGGSWGQERSKLSEEQQSGGLRSTED